MVILHHAANDLRMKTVGPLSVALATGDVFEYFDALRKILASATQELFFVDPYLNAEFVSRYLAQVQSGVAIRMLTQKYLPNLLPAAAAFAQQHATQIAIRSTPTEMHDRYVIVDGAACYQSGASFKDGARTAFTTLTQLVDVFDTVKATYEAKWQAAKKEM
jgi:hypothetical protein